MRGTHCPHKGQDRHDYTGERTANETGPARPLRDDAEKQQCLVVLLHAVPVDFTHDQLP
jgi:hypothetical protein